MESMSSSDCGRNGRCPAANAAATTAAGQSRDGA
jgi:hypothetical protein